MLGTSTSVLVLCSLKTVKYTDLFFLVHFSSGALVQLLNPDPDPVTLTPSFFIFFLCFPASCSLAYQPSSASLHDSFFHTDFNYSIINSAITDPFFLPSLACSLILLSSHAIPSQHQTVPIQFLGYFLNCYFFSLSPFLHVILPEAQIKSQMRIPFLFLSVKCWVQLYTNPVNLHTCQAVVHNVLFFSCST